jgi:hypothetical protein
MTDPQFFLVPLFDFLYTYYVQGTTRYLPPLIFSNNKHTHQLASYVHPRLHVY